MANKHVEQANDRLLTEVELELMTIIWNLGKATVKEVVTHLTKDRNLAYTTVATVMKVLEQKGLLECKKETYAHLFIPVVSKVEYEAVCLDHMVTHVFDGEPLALVQRLLHANKLSKEEIIKIENLLKNLAGN